MAKKSSLSWLHLVLLFQPQTRFFFDLSPSCVYVWIAALRLRKYCSAWEAFTLSVWWKLFTLCDSHSPSPPAFFQSHCIILPLAFRLMHSYIQIEAVMWWAVTEGERGRERTMTTIMMLTKVWLYWARSCCCKEQTGEGRGERVNTEARAELYESSDSPFCLTLISLCMHLYTHMLTRQQN